MQSSTERKRTLAFLAKSRAREPTNLDADEQVAMVQVCLVPAFAFAYMVAYRVLMYRFGSAAAAGFVTNSHSCIAGIELVVCAHIDAQEAAAYETLKKPRKKTIREILHPELSIGSEEQELIKSGEELSHV